ncbi:MAG: hypothetical protein J1E06_04070 [Acutalibacter sp.]|nr:hypothetical protein [Acutalibacter sp.]
MQTLEELYYISLPLFDFWGKNVVYLEPRGAISQSSVKLLLQLQNQRYGIKAIEDEIVATLAIDHINVNRDSVRRILKGMAPKDEQENRIVGLKNGFEFIADPAHKITEENLHRLYLMTVNDFLSDDLKWEEDYLYGHKKFYVVGDR